VSTPATVLTGFDAWSQVIFVRRGNIRVYVYTCILRHKPTSAKNSARHIHDKTVWVRKFGEYLGVHPPGRRSFFGTRQNETHPILKFEGGDEDKCTKVGI
jgi:hypothetical protein